jgi:hypothetical protein
MNYFKAYAIDVLRKLTNWIQIWPSKSMENLQNVFKMNKWGTLYLITFPYSKSTILLSFTPTNLSIGSGIATTADTSPWLLAFL